MSDTPTNAAVRVFDFKDQPVRIIGTADAPLFVAADVCRVLEIANTTDALKRLDEDESTLVSIEGIRGPGNPQVNAVTESGFYSLVLGSRKTQAREFKRWVTHEVLPAIRKTGRFELPAGGKQAEALQGPEVSPEPELLSVPEFLSAMDATNWPDRRMMAFGGCCRLIARNFALAYRSKVDPTWGEIRVYPIAALRLAWKRVVPGPLLQRPTPSDELFPVLAHAVAQLDADTVIGLRELVAAARELKLCRDVIPDQGAVSLSDRKAIGKRMATLRGKELLDGKGRRFAFFHSRVRTGVRYPICFVASEVEVSA